MIDDYFTHCAPCETYWRNTGDPACWICGQPGLRGRVRWASRMYEDETLPPAPSFTDAEAAALLL